MTYDPDVEALIGGTNGKRPPLAARTDILLDRLVRARKDQIDEPVSMDMSDVFGGVTVSWLAKVFGMDPTTVKQRLADCPPLHRRKAGYVYALPVAARYLVKPVFDVKAYLEKMKPSELPAQLQKDYWDSQLKRQKWEENAGDLWRTSAIMEVLGETFKTIKFSMQLWADNLETITALSPEQRQLLVQMVDGLQNEIHENLVKMSRDKSTPSVKAELSAPTSDEDLVG